MTCAEAEERLDDYVDGSLSEGEFQEVELHLGTCPRCREEERRLRAVLAAAAALPQALSPAHDLWPGILLRIGGGKSGRSRWGSSVGLAAAAVVVLALASTLGHRPPTVPPSFPRLPVAASAGDTLQDLEADYARATAALLTALNERRGSLSRETLASVEGNLEGIDRSLAEVREALRKDPDNGELTRMLLATHKKKLDVLRRVVKLSTQL